MSTADLDIGREALVSLVAKLTMSVFGFVGVIIFARVLGPGGAGRYYFALAVAISLVRVPAGIAKAIKKRVSEVGRSPEEYLSVGLIAHAVYLGVVGVLAFLLAPYLPLEEVATEEILGILLVLGSVGLFQILNKIYSGIGNPGASLWFDTVRSVFTLGFQLALLWIGMEAFGLLVGLAAATVLTAAMVAVASGVRPSVPTRETVRSTGEFARWSVPTAMVGDLYKRADPILIGIFAGASAVGFYETALRLVLPASQLAASISNPLHVKASGQSSLGEEVRDDVANALSYAGLFGIPMFFGALALPDVLMQTFYGKGFGDAGIALVGIALFYVFHIYQIPLESAISGTDKPELVFRVKLVGLIGYLPFGIALGRAYGLLGVIAATLVSEVVMFLVYQYLCRDVFDGFIFPRPIAAQIASAAVMFGVITWLETFLSLDNWVPVVALVGTGALVYFAVLSVTSSHFRLTARNVLSPIVRQVGQIA
ncbi:lipopolysaccharide biosynthesis protein [Halorussus ruber]|uniref:lipopolysaccharide biosynthesis protein n=1 Tax=Halorussus ruber TaxID=1126238 RepID=UPI001092FAB4|nr:oligosaccharide flippase family protein [Halorussus ruber]